MAGTMVNWKVLDFSKTFWFKNVKTPCRHLYAHSSVRGCYRLLVLPTTNFIRWSSKPQCNDIWRWNHWEVTRFKWMPMMALASLEEQEETRVWALSLWLMGTQWEGSDLQIRKEGSHQGISLLELDFRFLSFQNWEK